MVPHGSARPLRPHDPVVHVHPLDRRRRRVPDQRRLGLCVCDRAAHGDRPNRTPRLDLRPHASQCMDRRRVLVVVWLFVRGSAAQQCRDGLDGVVGGLRLGPRVWRGAEKGCVWRRVVRLQPPPHDLGLHLHDGCDVRLPRHLEPGLSWFAGSRVAVCVPSPSASDSCSLPACPVSSPR